MVFAIQSVVQLLPPAPIAQVVPLTVPRPGLLAQIPGPLLSVTISKACASTFRVARLVAAKPAKPTELFMGKGGSRLKVSIKPRPLDIGITLFLSER